MRFVLFGICFELHTSSVHRLTLFPAGQGCCCRLQRRRLHADVASQSAPLSCKFASSPSMCSFAVTASCVLRVTKEPIHCSVVASPPMFAATSPQWLALACPRQLAAAAAATTIFYHIPSLPHHRLFQHLSLAPLPPLLMPFFAASPFIALIQLLQV